MWKATFQGILGRKVRLALTALAVVLGVSFVTGTYVLTDTLQQSFGGVFRQSLAGVDVVVRPPTPFGGGGAADQERFPASALTDVAHVPGVGRATPFVGGYAQFVDRSGHAIEHSGAPTLGVSWAQRGDGGPLRLVDGGGRRSRPPTGPGEVAMDAGTAARAGFHVGDQIDVLLQGPKQRFTIVGLFALGDQRDLGAISFAAFDLATAQKVFNAPGQLDGVYVTAATGTTTDGLRRTLQLALPQYQVSSPQQVASDRGQVVLTFLDLLTQLLLGFAAIGMVVAALVIFNTFTILVAQRTRELGLLRTLGVSRSQLLVSVVVEATVIAAAASALGVGTGYGLAALLRSLAGNVGLDVPSGSLVLQARTVIAAVGVGVLVTVVASVWPALRAARVPPIAAAGGTAEPRRRGLRLRAVLGAALVASGVPLLVIGLHRTEFQSDVLREIWWVALGAVLVLVGALVLLAALAPPLVALLARPARRAGVPSRLARANAMRNPRRTAATASALVIGLALVGLVAIFGSSAKASVRRAVDGGVRADVVLKAPQFTTFSPEVARRVAALPAVETVTAFRFGNVRVPVAGNQETVAGASPEHLAQVVNLDLRSGRVADLGSDGVLASSDAARQYRLHVGDHVEMQMPQGIVTLRVAGVYGQQDFAGGFPISFIVAEPAYEQGFGSVAQDQLVYVRARPGAAAAARAETYAALSRPFPNVSVLTRAEFRQDQQNVIDRFLAVAVALLMLSELIAVLGIVNTLALSVFERTHELGLLRVVGMSRRQLRRMIRGESVLVAVVGGLVGTAVGLLWGWVFTVALRSEGLTSFSVPAVQLVAFLALSVVAGVVAALGPAWRAAHLDTLEAIAAE